MQKRGILAFLILITLIVAPATYISGINRSTNGTVMLVVPDNSNAKVPIFNTHVSTTAIKTQTLTLSYQIKVLFDDSHSPKYDSSDMSEFLNDLVNEYNVTVDVHSSGEINSTVLEGYDVLIIPGPQSTYTEEEGTAIKNFIANGGVVLIMGLAYYKTTFDPDYLANITDEYGVFWYDAEVKDKTNYDYGYYNPIIHVWKNNTVSNFVSNDSSWEVEAASTTALNITGVNDSTKTIYIVGTGDDDTYIEFRNGTQKTWGYNTYVFAAVDLTSGGRLFITGSSAMFRSDLVYYYLDTKWNTRDFAMRVFHWLLAEGLEIVSYEVPTDPIISGQIAYLNVTIKNNNATAVDNVHLGIEFEGDTLELINSTNDVNVGSLNSGEEKTFTWAVRATGTGVVKVVFDVWADDILGFSRTASVNTLGLELSAWAEPEFIVLSNWNYTELTVNVTNPITSGTTANNINVTLTLEEGLYTNGTNKYHIDSLAAGETKLIKWKINASTTKGIHPFILVDLECENMGTASTSVQIGVYTDKYILFDQGHDQYWKVDDFSQWIDLLKRWFNGNVRINNGTFEENVVLNASLIIIPDIGDNITVAEQKILRDFLENHSGNLWIMGYRKKYFESWQVGVYDNITGEYGIRWYDDQIYDDEHNVEGSSSLPILYEFADNPVAIALTFGVDAVKMPSSNSLNVTDPAVPVVLGNPTSYAENETGDRHLNGTDIVAVAAVEILGGGKIFATGSTTMYIDSYGNLEYHEVFVNKTLMWFFYTGNVAPQVEITSPVDDSWLNTRSFDVMWSVSEDYKVWKQEVWLDAGAGYSKVADLGSEERTYHFDLPADGMYKIKIVAYDWAGLSSYHEITVYVDTEAPTVSFVNIANNTWMNTRTFVINWTIDDAMASYGSIALIELYINGELEESWPSMIDGANITVNSDGTYNITVLVMDTANHIGKATIFVNVDTAAPTVDITAPANGTIYELDGSVNVTVNWTVSDNMVIDKVELYLNDTKKHTAEEAGSYTLEITSEGVYYIKVVAYDAAGNKAEDEIMIIVKAKAAPPGIPMEYAAAAAIAIIAIIGVIVYFMKFKPKE